MSLTLVGVATVAASLGFCALAESRLAWIATGDLIGIVGTLAGTAASVAGVLLRHWNSPDKRMVAVGGLVVGYALLAPFIFDVIGVGNPHGCAILSAMFAIGLALAGVMLVCRGLLGVLRSQMKR